MQYQHLVFEEFARKVQPNVDPFVFTNSADIDPAIVAEFAHAVYRFGHSMLTDTVDRLDNELSTSDGTTVSLFDGVPQPAGLRASGRDASMTAAGAIIRGMSRQAGNEIDEFVVDALRNQLLGLPLDLAALNIARGRDTGMPSLNDTRAQFYETTGDDRAQALRRAGSISRRTSRTRFDHQLHRGLWHASTDHRRDHARGQAGCRDGDRLGGAAVADANAVIDAIDGCDDRSTS